MTVSGWPGNGFPFQPGRPPCWSTRTAASLRAWWAKAAPRKSKTRSSSCATKCTRKVRRCLHRCRRRCATCAPNRRARSRFPRTHWPRVRACSSATPGITASSNAAMMAACGFQLPQGLAIDNDTLYVADAGNHCVRRVRLDPGEVETVLGSGRPAYSNVEEQGGGLRVTINAPNAVAVEGAMLYVAASGQHQILRADLHHQRVETIAGDGRSDVRDGIGGQSSLSQPLALASMPGQLLIADAGGNAIRRLRFADLALTTLVGSSPWEPGRHDGAGRKARLAYPSGIAVDENRVYFADTCNDRLCVLDPYSGEVATLQTDYPLHEPQGMSFAAGALWVADRNDHAILRIDPARGTCERVAVDE